LTSNQAHIRPITSHPEANRRHVRRWIDLVQLLVLRDLRVRYRGSVLGYLWSMMNPLLYMLVLGFVFSHIMRFKIENFSLFILSGILCWNLFAQSLTIGTNSIIANGSLLKKVRVPAALFPSASVASCFVNFLLALIPYTCLALIMGQHIGFSVLALPLSILPFLMFVVGAALTLGSFNVRYRDIGHTLEPLLTMTFYATPIVYPITELPTKYQTIAWLNPMAHYVACVRAALFDGKFPELFNLGTAWGFGILSLALGLIVIRRQRDAFIYHL